MDDLTYPTYTVDGISLDGPGWYLAPGTRRRPIPAPRAVSVRVPGRSGELPLVGRDLETTIVPLTLHVVPVWPDGTEGGYEALERNLEALSAVFGVRHRLLGVRYLAAPGIVRVAEATVLTASDPDVDVGNAVAQVTVVLTVPGVVWRDEATPGTWNGLLPGAAQAVTPLAGSTAAIGDALVRLTGPALTPALTDLATGASLTAPTLLDGQRLIVDCAAMRATLAATDTWDLAAGSDVTGTIGSTGPGSASRWLPLTPATAGGDPHSRTVLITATAAGTTASSRLQIRARRCFL